MIAYVTPLYTCVIVREPEGGELLPWPMALQVARLPPVVQPPGQPSRTVPELVAFVSEPTAKAPKLIVEAVTVHCTARAGVTPSGAAKSSAAAQRAKARQRRMDPVV